MIRSAMAILAFTGNCLLAAAVQAGPPLMGEFERFIVHDQPRPALQGALRARDGATHRIADFNGRTVLVNFWASSCEGSRYEVPTLNALQQKIGGDRFSVVLVASDEGGWIPVNLFMNALGITIANSYLDNGLSILRESGLTETRMGSILYNEQGLEIGRIDGWADWDTAEARALIEYFIDPANQ